MNSDTTAPQGSGVEALRALLRGCEKDAVSPERIAIRDALRIAITLLTAQPRTDAAQQGEVVAAELQTILSDARALSRYGDPAEPGILTNKPRPCAVCCFWAHSLTPPLAV